MNHSVECPYCKETIRDLIYLDWRADIAEFECSHCGLPVEVEREIFATYKARRTDEEAQP